MNRRSFIKIVGVGTAGLLAVPFAFAGIDTSESNVRRDLAPWLVRRSWTRARLDVDDKAHGG